MLGTLDSILGFPESHIFENKIFNSVMLLVTITGIISTTYNIILNNYFIITICSASSVVFTGFIYGYSRKTGDHRPLVYPTLLYFFLIMVIGWIVNAGTNGADAYFFFLFLTCGILLLPKPMPWFMIAVVLSICGLLYVEFLHPSLLIGYENQTQRFFDIGISLILCLIFNGVIIHVVFRQYLKERQEKDALLAEVIREKVELEKAQKEIRVLRGSLPICANCKMIRDAHGRWYQMEEYICMNSEAKFSHGICPECVRSLYPANEFERW
jgi:hypothetical protein